MKRNHYLKELVGEIKKTEDMIAMHKAIGDLQLITGQYEAIKAKQVTELIHNLVIPPCQTIESISAIKQIIDRFYPDIPADIIKANELKALLGL